jgi:hypothetical protein
LNKPVSQLTKPCCKSQTVFAYWAVVLEKP